MAKPAFYLTMDPIGLLEDFERCLDAAGFQQDITGGQQYYFTVAGHGIVDCREIVEDGCLLSRG